MAGDRVEIFQASANKAGKARVGVFTPDVVLSQGSTVSISLELRNDNNLTIERLQIDEETPFPIGVWDWLQYLSFKYDRLFQNVFQPKGEQNPLEYRVDFKPRVEAEYVTVTAFEWEGIYNGETPNTDQVFRLIKEAIDLPYWEFEPATPVVSVRITSTGDTRVTEDGNRRIANFSEAA